MHLANAPHGRYVLACRVAVAHRGEQWRDRVTANRAVAYRIHEDTGRGRWYLTASWTIPPVKTVPLAAARTNGVVGVDTNADHLAAWRLDRHGNPVGTPRRFDHDLSGTAHRNDEQGHRTVQAGSVAPGREGTRPRVPGPRTRSVRAGRGAKAGTQDTQHRSGRPAEHESSKTGLTPAQSLGPVSLEDARVVA